MAKYFLNFYVGGELDSKSTASSLNEAKTKADKFILENKDDYCDATVFVRDTPYEPFEGDEYRVAKWIDNQLWYGWAKHGMFFPRSFYTKKW